MTLTDLERRNAIGQIYLSDLHNTLVPSDLERPHLARCHKWGRGVFLGSQPAPSQGGPTSPKFWASYMLARSRRNSNQILGSDHANCMWGKFIHGRPVSVLANFLMTGMLTRDLFAVATVLVYIDIFDWNVQSSSPFVCLYRQSELQPPYSTSARPCPSGSAWSSWLPII